jgi:riboflavin kinase/FMN adenylyltransferase
MLLTTLEEKKRFVPHFFDGVVLVLEFNTELMNLSAEEFVKQVLVEAVGVKHLVVGYDHTLGKDRVGNAQELARLGKKFGFDVEVVDPVFCGGAAVSSSRIRKALIAGQYDEALDLLGHDYAVYGKVVKGIGLGRKFGYPTANIAYGSRKLLPPQGVYACWAQVGDEELNGMMFVGQNHFNPETAITVEANLFDFDRDIYDEYIVVHPTHFVRENRKFETENALVNQIDQDKKRVLEIAVKGEKTCQ